MRRWAQPNDQVLIRMARGASDDAAIASGFPLAACQLWAGHPDLSCRGAGSHRCSCTLWESDDDCGWVGGRDLSVDTTAGCGRAGAGRRRDIAGRDGDDVAERARYRATEGEATVSVCLTDARPDVDGAASERTRFKSDPRAGRWLARLSECAAKHGEAAASAAPDRRAQRDPAWDRLDRTCLDRRGSGVAIRRERREKAVPEIAPGGTLSRGLARSRS
jgi:hypothetical protein